MNLIRRARRLYIDHETLLGVLVAGGFIVYAVLT